MSVRTFVIQFYYGSETVINFGSRSAKVRNESKVCGSATAKSYGSDPAKQ